MKKIFQHHISLNVVRLNKLALGVGIGVLSIVLYIITSTPSAKTDNKKREENNDISPVSFHENSVPHELLSASNAIPGHEKEHDEISNNYLNSLRSTQSEENELPDLTNLQGTANESLQIAYKSPLTSFSQQNISEPAHATVIESPTLEPQLLKARPYTLQAGSLIPSIMQSGINSDLSGDFTALVRHSVFDSASGKFLLIPQGSRLILVYDNKIVMGQQRLIVAAKRLLFPNGSSLDLGCTPVTDDIGMVGLKDKVDNHYFRLFGNSLLIGLISGGVQLAQPKITSDHPSSLDVLSGTVGMQISQTAMNAIDRQTAVQPTLQIRPGQTFNIQLSKDLVFSEPYQDRIHD